MNCDEARGLFAESWTGAIAVQRQRELDGHLSNCAGCRAEQEQLRQVWQRLDAWPDESPSPSLRARFYESLESYREGFEMARPAPAKAPWWRLPVFQFAAVAAALVVGVVIGQKVEFQREQSRDQSELAQLRGEVNNMRQMVALSLLQQQSANDRLRGVTYAYRVPKDDAEVLGALLETVRNDANVNVRLAAVDALRKFGSSAVVRKALVQAITKQDSPMVQIAIIELLVDLNDKTAVEPMKGLLEDGRQPPEVQQRLRWAMKQLSE
jgi:hypothetical protein